MINNCWRGRKKQRISVNLPRCSENINRDDFASTAHANKRVSTIHGFDIGRSQRAFTNRLRKKNTEKSLVGCDVDTYYVILRVGIISNHLHGVLNGKKKVPSTDV